MIASRPSQSPKLDSDIDSHSRRKSRTRSTARSLATSPTPHPCDVGGRRGVGAVDRRGGARRLASVVGTADSRSSAARVGGRSRRRVALDGSSRYRVGRSDGLRGRFTSRTGRRPGFRATCRRGRD